MDSERNSTYTKTKKSPPDSQGGARAWSLDALTAAMCAERNIEPLRSFEQLAKLYEEGRDYEIECRRGATSVLCAAWHGGTIERGVDLLAEAIAGGTFSFYAFRALQDAALPHPLRITSTRFNEPRLLSLARESDMVVGIHCCDTAPGVQRIFVGGGASSSTRAELIEILRANDFNAGHDQLFPGHHHANPCNLGRVPGLQLEVTQAYMNSLLRSEKQFQKLADTVSMFLHDPTIRVWDKRSSRQKS